MVVCWGNLYFPTVLACIPSEGPHPAGRTHTWLSRSGLWDGGAGVSQAHRPTDTPSDDRTQLLPSIVFWLQVRCKSFLEGGPSVCLPLCLATEDVQSVTAAAVLLP